VRAHSNRKNFINHVGIAVDKSGSMASRRRAVIKVIDGLVKQFAEASVKEKMETRISVFAFDNEVECLVWDTDVLRMPSIADVYQIGYTTALRDATWLMLKDFQTQVGQKYGDHAFLMYVATDGLDNSSSRSPSELKRLIDSQSDNVTVAALVPDETGRRKALEFGFPEGNIAIWDATSDAGVEAAGQTIATSYSGYMTSRRSGVRGTRKLFGSVGAEVNSSAVRAADLTPLAPAAYKTYTVEQEYSGDSIASFVTDKTGDYRRGSVFYQFTNQTGRKKEVIQPQKEIVVRRKKDGELYHGPNARKMLGLPDFHAVIKPEENPDWDIFVQSTSYTRKLVGGTDLIVLQEQ